jgi:hypothetical protein
MSDLKSLDTFVEEALDSAERAALGIDVAIIEVLALVDAKLANMKLFDIALPADVVACHFRVDNTSKKC